MRPQAARTTVTPSTVSVVTWDSSFRESLHWFDAMQSQAHSTSAEFIWVDYYGLSQEVSKSAARDSRTHPLSLERPSDEPWHLGRSVNAGVSSSQHSWLLLTDGDIFVGPDFLQRVAQLHTDPWEVTYFRRYDEPAPVSATDPLPPCLENLEANCILGNPTNFGACALVHRSLFDAVGGYEEHEAFAGPGIASMELNFRLRNAGAAIRWSDIPTYHPWHTNTGLPNDATELERLFSLSRTYPWLLPYAGIDQSWIAHCRNIELDAKASISRCDDYLAALPEELKRGD